MITIDATISLLAGSALALSLPKDSPEDDHRLLHKGLLYQSCVLSPVIFYFMTRYPDWEWNYFFPAKDFFTNSTATASLIFVLIMAALNFSFYLGFRIVQNKRKRTNKNCARNFVLIVAAILVATSLLIACRAIQIGTYEAYHSGQAEYIWQNLEFMLTLLMSGIVVGPTYYYFLLRKSR